MNRTALINSLRGVAGVILGVSAHHFGGKLLDRKEILAGDAKGTQCLDNIKSNVDYLVSWAEKKHIPAELNDTIQNKVDDIVNTSNTLKDAMDSSPNMENAKEGISKLVKLTNEGCKCLNELLEPLLKSYFRNIGAPKNNFISNLNIQNLYDFLDSLTLLEESAFIHILIFIILLCSLINIISIFFGNEIIRYFNLEKRLPKLETIFRLRTKFQRYYLLWNIFIMVIVCILAICLNLLVLI